MPRKSKNYNKCMNASEVRKRKRNESRDIENLSSSDGEDDVEKRMLMARVSCFCSHLRPHPHHSTPEN